MPVRSGRGVRATALFVGGVLVLLAAAVAGGVLVYRARQIDDRIHVTVRADGVDERIELGAEGRVSDALIRAGVSPHDGQLFSAKDRRVLDPKLHPAVITMSGKNVNRDYPLFDGAVIESVDGKDEVEKTKTIRETIPIPPLRETLVHVYEAGAPGMAERTVGVRSGEIIEQKVLVKAIPAKPTKRKVVALTFDDGPNDTWTPMLLELLKEKGVKATFCQVGTNVKRLPEMSRRAEADGHQLCNHSATHDTGLRSKTREAIDAEIDGGITAFTDEGLPAPQYYRPAGGFLNDLIRDVAWNRKQTIIYWKVDTQDWKSGATIESILDNTNREVDPGAIILMHDGGGKGRGLSVFATAVLIDHLRAQGYEFVFPIIPR